MTKYEKITEYLSQAGQGDWTASFTEIEEVLEFSLPASARRHKAWWANNWHSQSRGWMSAGFRAIRVDLENEIVTFRKTATPFHGVPAPKLFFARKVAAELMGLTPAQVTLTVRP